jgi:hypothetical protein
MRLIRYRLALPLLTLSAIIIIVVVVGMLHDYNGSEVCLKCGATRRTTHYRIPGTEIGWQSSSPPASTAFSQFVSSQGLVTTHEHDWWLGSGGARNLLGKMCLLGKTREVDDAVRKEEPIRLLEALGKYGFAKERDEVLAALLSPERARAARDLGLMFVNAAPSSAKELEEWMEEHEDYWAELRGLSHR